MAHQIIISLTDQEYEELASAAKQNGQRVEDIAHRRLMLEHIRLHRKESIDPLTEALFLAGDIGDIPSDEPVSPEEVNEFEQLVQQIELGPSLSDMVLEDRGPRA